MSARMLAPALGLLALTLATKHAHADPGAWRGPAPGRGLTVAYGVPEGSLAAGITDRVAATLEWRAGTAVGLGAAVRVPLLGAGSPYGWGLELVGGAAARVLRFGPGVSLELTPGLLLRRRWERFYGGLVLVAPMALTGEPAVRFTPMLEGWLGVRAGAVWLGLAGGAGITLTGGYQPALALQGGLTASVPY